MLLHGAVPLLLCSTACYSEVWGAVAELAMTWVRVRVRLRQLTQLSPHSGSRKTHPSAALATGRVVMVAQRTDNNVVLVRNREGSSERRSRRHGQHLSAVSVRVCGSSPGRVQDCRTAGRQVEAVNGTCRALQRLGEAVSELENGSQRAGSCSRSRSCSCSGSAHQAPQAKAGRG